MNTMNCIEVTDGPINGQNQTRLYIGCDDIATDMQEWLVANGHTVDRYPVKVDPESDNRSIPEMVRVSELVRRYGDTICAMKLS